MSIGIVVAVTVIAFVVWISQTAFRNLRSGTCPRETGSGSGVMPPSGPDVGSGIGPT